MTATRNFFTNTFFSIKSTAEGEPFLATTPSDKIITTLKESILHDQAKSFLKTFYPDVPHDDATIQAFLNTVASDWIPARSCNSSVNLPQIKPKAFKSFIKTPKFVDYVFETIIHQYILNYYALPDRLPSENQLKALEAYLDQFGQDDAFRIQHLYDEHQNRLSEDSLKFQLKITLFNRMRDRGWITSPIKNIQVNDTAVYLSSEPSFSWVTENSGHRTKFTHWFKQNQSKLAQEHTLPSILDACFKQKYNKIKTKHDLNKLERLLLNVVKVQTTQLNQLTWFVDHYQALCNKILKRKKLGLYVNYLLNNHPDQDSASNILEHYRPLIDQRIDIEYLNTYLNALSSQPHKQTALISFIGKDKLRRHINAHLLNQCLNQLNHFQSKAMLLTLLGQAQVTSYLLNADTNQDLKNYLQYVASHPLEEQQSLLQWIEKDKLYTYLREPTHWEPLFKAPETHMLAKTLDPNDIKQLKKDYKHELNKSRALTAAAFLIGIGLGIALGIVAILYFPGILMATFIAIGIPAISGILTGCLASNELKQTVDPKNTYRYFESNTQESPLDLKKNILKQLDKMEQTVPAQPSNAQSTEGLAQYSIFAENQPTAQPAAPTPSSFRPTETRDKRVEGEPESIEKSTNFVKKSSQISQITRQMALFWDDSQAETTDQQPCNPDQFKLG